MEAGTKKGAQVGAAGRKAPSTSRTWSILALYAIAVSVIAGSVVWSFTRAAAPPRQDRSKAAEEHFLRGQELARVGDTKAAEESLQTAIALDPGYAPAHFAIADMYDSAGRPVLAAEKLKALLAANPNAPHVLCRQAELYLKAGGFEKGVQKARDELRKDPRCSLAQSVMGMAQSMAGNGKAAADSLRAAQKAAPNDARIPRTLVQVLGNSGQVQEALAIAQELLRKDPESAQFEYLVGWLYSKSEGKIPGARAQALRHLTKAVSLDPDYAAANAALGTVLARMNQPEMAMPLLIRARDAGSFDLETAKTMAAVGAKLKKPGAPALAAQVAQMEAASNELEKRRAAWLAHPEDKKNALRLAELERQRGDAPDARDLVMGILKQDPNDPEALKLLETIIAKR